LVIQPSGSKSWALRFRRNGKTAKMTLGRVDPLGEMEGDPVLGGLLTLAAARTLATKIMRERATGKDVIGDAMTAKRRRRVEGEQRQAQNFAVVARRYIEEYARRLPGWCLKSPDYQTSYPIPTRLPSVVVTLPANAID
jgi:hypothetical protein